MAIALDETDVQLLNELQRDADRPNVELARLVGLSPAATLHRVRKLKDAGVIAQITARLDAAAAGFPLLVYVLVRLGGHAQTTEQRFEQAVRRIPQVLSADWVAGETDALLQVAAHDLAELHSVLGVLSSRGGAQRVVTLLRLQQLKPQSPLPVAVSPVG